MDQEKIIEITTIEQLLEMSSMGGGDVGGGGTGQTPNNCGSNGTANTGGGAGGANGNPVPGKTGGSGIVIIRYKSQ